MNESRRRMQARVSARMMRWTLFLMAFWSASRAWYHHAVTDHVSAAVLHAAAAAVVLTAAILRAKSPHASRPLVSWWAALSAAATFAHFVQQDEPTLFKTLFLVGNTAIYMGLDYLDAGIVRDAERAADDPPGEDGLSAAGGATGR